MQTSAFCLGVFAGKMDGGPGEAQRSADLMFQEDEHQQFLALGVDCAGWITNISVWGKLKYMRQSFSLFRQKIAPIPDYCNSSLVGFRLGCNF
jgi:hypothetical protein